MKNDRDRMKSIISETIVALCNSGLDFSSELSVEGLLGITLDGRDILLVNINEVIKPYATKAKRISSRNIVSDKEGILSEVTTSSDPTPTADPFVESHDTDDSTDTIIADNTYSTQVPAQAQLSDASGEIVVRKREDCLIGTAQVKVKSEPEEVISIDDDEEGDTDSRYTDAKLECQQQFGIFESYDNYTEAELAQPIAPETTAQCYVIQHSQPNTYTTTSDQFSETEESTTDERGLMPSCYQKNVLSAPTTPMPVSPCANVSPQKVSSPVARMCQRSQRQLYRRYNQAALSDAVKAVQSGEMTVNRASKVFTVPRSTIQLKILRLSGKTTWGSRGEKTGSEKTDSEKADTEKAGSESTPRNVSSNLNNPVNSRDSEDTPSEDQQQNCGLSTDSEHG